MFTFTQASHHHLILGNATKQSDVPFFCFLLPAFLSSVCSLFLALKISEGSTQSREGRSIPSLTELDRESCAYQGRSKHYCPRMLQDTSLGTFPVIPVRSSQAQCNTQACFIWPNDFIDWESFSLMHSIAFHLQMPDFISSISLGTLVMYLVHEVSLMPVLHWLYFSPQACLSILEPVFAPQCCLPCFSICSVTFFFCIWFSSFAIASPP